MTWSSSVKAKNFHKVTKTITKSTKESNKAPGTNIRHVRSWITNLPWWFSRTWLYKRCDVVKVLPILRGAFWGICLYHFPNKCNTHTVSVLETSILVLKRASNDFFSASSISICICCCSNLLWMKSISDFELGFVLQGFYSLLFGLLFRIFGGYHDIQSHCFEILCMDNISLIVDYFWMQ